MSSMLEQAIVDAAALREAALKNAEQAIIDKYAPQIKEAVDSLLDKDVINEQEVGAQAAEPQSLEAPFAAAPAADPEQDVTLTLSDDDQIYEFDLDKIKMQMQDEGPAPAEDGTTTPELASDLGLGELGGDEPEDEGEDDLGIGDDLLQEIADLVSDIDEELLQEEQDLIEEEVTMEMSGQHKNGTFETNEDTLKYQEEMQKAIEEIEGLEEENKDLKKENKGLTESYKVALAKNKKLLQIVKKLDNSLNETLLSNAKLLYSNKTLSDASLNERQKVKIVEAIAKAKTPEEAKNLQEALKTTVGSTKKDGPKSLRESVNRKSNLSGIMPRRKQPEQEFSFADQMKKLAGIK